MCLKYSESGQPCGFTPCERCAKAEEENDLAGLYARSLAVSIWRRRYSSDSPAWEPLGTTAGVISQIDNMVAGLMNDLSKAEAENSKLREALAFYAYAPGGDNLIMVERGEKARNTLKEVG